MIQDHPIFLESIRFIRSNLMENNFKVDNLVDIEVEIAIFLINLVK